MGIRITYLIQVCSFVKLNNSTTQISLEAHGLTGGWITHILAAETLACKN